MNNLKIYPEFVANQTLSHENLNDIFQYLDKEIRQGRQQLIGTGILCGFNLHPQGPNTYLTPGIAVTTEGHLLAMATQFNFKYYRVFNNKSEQEAQNELLPHLAFQSDVIEVLSEIPEDETEDNLLEFFELDQKYREGVVVVYLEDHLKDIESCEGESCDNKGKEHHLSLKILIIAKSQAAMFVDSDSGFYADLNGEETRHPAYNIGQLKITRPLITEKIIALDQLIELFQGCVNKAIEDLRSFIDKIKIVFPKEFAQLEMNTNDFLTIAQKFKSDYSNFQQIYDWFETLFRALNEWLGYVQNTHLQCINKSRNFPRHVFTGSMNKQAFDPQLYRHYFEASQKNTLSLDQAEILQLLSQRVKLIFSQIDINKLNRIAILPEKRTSVKLSDRAIPYFLNYTALKRYWVPSSDLRKRLDFDNFGVNRQKLSCSFEDKDFFRIEGHIGKSRKAALEELAALRANYNLEFDIKALYVDEPKKSAIHDCCSYETLLLMYQATAQGFKAQLLETFAYISRFRKFRKDLEYVSTPKLSRYARQGYIITDYRQLELFETRTKTPPKEESPTKEVPTDLAAKVTEEILFENIGDYIAKNPNAASAEVEKALAANNAIWLEGGNTKSEIYLENMKLLENFALERNVVMLENQPALNITDGAPMMKKLSTGMKISEMGAEEVYISEELYFPEEKSVNDQLNNKIREMDKILESEGVKENPELKKQIESIMAGVRAAAEKTVEVKASGKRRIDISDFKVIRDGIHTLLVHDELERVQFVETNPHQSRYSGEVLIEKIIPSLMIDIYELSKKVPTKLETYDDSLIEELIFNLNTKVFYAYRAIDQIYDDYKCHIAIKIIFQILVKLSFSSFVAQLKIIKQLFNDKERQIEEKNILANIVKKNPGLEHRAGVPIGGTFFLLTKKGGQATVAPSSESYIKTVIELLQENGSENAKIALRYIRESGTTDQEKILAILAELNLYGIIGEEIAKRNEKYLVDIRDDNMADDVVIGDFCLYSTIECCDIRYIVHTDLRLKSTKKVYCDDDKKVNLDVHPRGGTIFGNGTAQVGHNYTFDPSHPEVKIGENIITYALADEKVDLAIEVLKHPTAKIVVVSKKIEDGVAIIEVKAESTGGTVHEWSYDDKKYEKGIENYTYKIPAKGPKVDITLKLKVSNIACFVEVTEKVTLTDVQLILGKTIVCSNDKPVSLTGKPPGGTFSGEGVKDGKFNPGEIKFEKEEVVKEIDITYTFEGDSETKTIVVIRHPKAEIKVVEEQLEPEVAVLQLQNATEPLKEYFYVWDINGIKSTKEEIHDGFKYNTDGEVVVNLLAYHPKLVTCADSTEIIFKRPDVLPPIEEEEKEVKEIDTFNVIKKMNAKNAEFFKLFTTNLANIEYNPKVLTAQEIKLTQSLINFLNQVTQDKLMEVDLEFMKGQFLDVSKKIRSAVELGIAGPELTLFGVRLATLLNISAILSSKLAVKTQLNSIVNNIEKLKADNPTLKYTLQQLVGKEFWQNSENQTRAYKFWDAIQP